MCIWTPAIYLLSNILEELSAISFIHVLGPQHNWQKPHEVFEDREHVLNWFLWAFIRCCTLYSYSGAKCTYEVFPALRWHLTPNTQGDGYYIAVWGKIFHSLINPLSSTGLLIWALIGYSHQNVEIFKTVAAQTFTSACSSHGVKYMVVNLFNWKFGSIPVFTSNISGVEIFSYVQLCIFLHDFCLNLVVLRVSLSVNIYKDLLYVFFQTCLGVF